MDGVKETGVAERSRPQGRWDSFGEERAREIRDCPAGFVMDGPNLHRFYFRKRQAYPDIMRKLGRLAGKSVLDMGCGRGEFSVHMAKQGARVSGVDIGPGLVECSRLLAEVNRVECRFTVASATRLPAADGEFDFVVGLSVLHHLSKADLLKALSEAHRALKAGGRALFHEPVENSPAFNCIQNIVPAGRPGDRYYRPSALCRRKWKAFRAKSDNRVLTDRELVSAGALFRETSLRHYGLTIRLARVFGEVCSPLFRVADRLLLAGCPPLSRFSQTVLVEYVKDEAQGGRKG